MAKATDSVQLNLYKSDFKFSAAHFLIFDENRAERLHGHNYQVKLRLGLPANLSGGLHKDFGEFKQVIRQLVADWDERVLLPGNNSEFDFTESGAETEVRFRDRRYVFPSNEVTRLDCENTSVEELSRLFCQRFVKRLDDPDLRFIEVEIEETAGQSAVYRHSSS